MYSQHHLVKYRQESHLCMLAHKARPFTHDFNLQARTMRGGLRARRREGGSDLAWQKSAIAITTKHRWGYNDNYIT